MTETPDKKRIDRVTRCFDAEGRLVRWPSKRADQIVVLWVLWTYIPDGRYDEPEINSMLRDWNAYEDYALLRRDMVDLGLLQRTPDGRIYRKVSRDDLPTNAQAVLARFMTSA